VIPGKRYTPEALLGIALRRKWLIVIPSLVIGAAVGVATHMLPNRYRSDTLILVVPQRVPESYVRSTVTTRIEDRLQAISQQILSRTRLERVIQDFNLYSDRRKSDLMEDIVERMRRDIDVEIVKGDAFRVSFTAEEPRTAMRVTERLASLFIDESLRDREILANDTNTFLESQLDDARRRLVENEKRLAEYRRLHDGELPTQLDANMQGLHNTEMQLQALVDSLNRDRDRRLVLERMVADLTPAETASSTADRRPADGEKTEVSTADRLGAAEALRREMLLRLTPEHPDVLRLNRTIESLRKRLEAEGPQRDTGPAKVLPSETARRSRLQDTRAEIENLDRQMAQKSAEEKRLHAVMGQYQKRIEIAPGRESELAELTRDYDTLQQTYRGLLAKKQESQISANLERRQIGEQFKILDPARLPERPYSPDRPRLYTMGLLGSLLFGFACAGAAEYLDRTLRFEEDVRLALNLPVIATIPVLAEPSRSRR
jgi:polysaccharide chain length determinant protein (PEP-CTERM system associated)